MYTCHLVSELQNQLHTPSLTLSWVKVGVSSQPRDDSFVRELPDNTMYISNLTLKVLLI